MKREKINLPIKFSATVEGKHDVNIIPQIGGQIMSVDVIVGQKVSKGQRLFLIDDRPAKNNVAACQANLISAIAQMETARLEYESNKNLYEKKIVSDYMLNTALNEYDRSKAKVAQSEASLEQAKLDLAYCSVLAPVDGLVGNITYNPGDLVNTVTVLTTISGTSEMKVRFSIAEKTFQSFLDNFGDADKFVKMAPEVRLVLKNGTEYAYKGKIARVAGQVDKTTGAIVIESFFPNPDGILYSGSQGNVHLDIPWDEVMCVPLTSIFRIQDKTLVYKVVDGKAVSTVVSISEGIDAEYAAVLSGLEVGDVIVAKGVNNIFDGMQVIFPESNNTAAADKK